MSIPIQTPFFSIAIIDGTSGTPITPYHFRERATVLLLTSTARLFQAYFAAKILVSRFVAKTWPAFRSLWRGTGTEILSTGSGGRSFRGLPKKAPRNKNESHKVPPPPPTR